MLLKHKTVHRNFQVSVASSRASRKCIVIDGQSDVTFKSRTCHRRASPAMCALHSDWESIRRQLDCDSQRQPLCFTHVNCTATYWEIQTAAVYSLYWPACNAVLSGVPVIDCGMSLLCTVARLMPHDSCLATVHSSSNQLQTLVFSSTRHYSATCQCKHCVPTDASCHCSSIVLTACISERNCYALAKWRICNRHLLLLHHMPKTESDTLLHCCLSLRLLNWTLNFFYIDRLCFLD